MQGQLHIAPGYLENKIIEHIAVTEVNCFFCGYAYKPLIVKVLSTEKKVPSTSSWHDMALPSGSFQSRGAEEFGQPLDCDATTGEESAFVTSVGATPEDVSQSVRSSGIYVSVQRDACFQSVWIRGLFCGHQSAGTATFLPIIAHS